MPYQPLDLGTALNSGDGEYLRSAGEKIDEMLAEIFSILATDGFPVSYIPNSAVTNAKLASVPAGTVKGNLTGSVAAPSDNTLTALLNALPLPAITSLTGGYTVLPSDRGRLFLLDGTFTLSLTAVASLASGFCFGVKNIGSGTVTIDPNASETINGSTTLSLAAGKEAMIFSTGSLFLTFGLTP